MERSAVFPCCRTPVPARRIKARLCGSAVFFFLTFTAAWGIPESGQSDLYLKPLRDGYSRNSSLLASLAPPPYSIMSQPEYGLKSLQSIESYPEVIVFPVQIAGNILSFSPRRLNNKVAFDPANGSIAVIYPELNEPYRSVFEQILSGIKEKTNGRAENIAVGQNVNIEELNNSLRRKDTKVVIALGRQGMKIASALDKSIGIVAGGVLSAPEAETREVQVNSLSPDPALLFSRLKTMMPDVRRIYTVYNSRQNAWVVRIAKEAARGMGLELVAYDVQDLHGAMLAYQEILAKANVGEEALWLPQDSTTVEDSSVLPFVLQESWKRNLAVFSSNIGHVKRGVLFSLYPDNAELGRHLADSALGMMASRENAGGITPLREVLMAVNLRTAKHLELDISHWQKFDATFPEQ
jgi:putative ABC transport system substrate-binding protein